MKIFYFLMLAISISSHSLAQENSNKTISDKMFDQPTEVTRKFLIALDKGNKVQIALANINDLDHLNNLDSMFRMLMQDIEPFKDSLSDELTSKRIDYLVDSTGAKKIRLQQYRPQGAVYLLNKGEAAALKLEQDTINYIGAVYYGTKDGTFLKTRYYRISFFLNNINQLPACLNGSLQQKVSNLRQNISSKWISSSDGQTHLKKDYTVSADVHNVYVAGSDFIALTAGADIQNYKNYFVPSLSIGAALTLNNSYFKRQIGLFWEPQFLFFKNGQGQLQTYRNDFLTLILAQGFIRDSHAKKELNFLSIISLGYQVKRSGGYYDKNSFRFGAGRLSILEGRVKLEPAIYFNNFFKGVTPSLRLSMSF